MRKDKGLVPNKGRDFVIELENNLHYKKVKITILHIRELLGHGNIQIPGQLAKGECINVSCQRYFFFSL